MYTWDGRRVDFTLYPRCSKIDLDDGMWRLNSEQQHGNFQDLNSPMRILFPARGAKDCAGIKSLEKEIERWLNKFVMRISEI